MVRVTPCFHGTLHRPMTVLPALITSMVGLVVADQPIATRRGPVVADLLLVTLVFFRHRLSHCCFQPLLRRPSIRLVAAGLVSLPPLLCFPSGFLGLWLVAHGCSSKGFPRRFAWFIPILPIPDVPRGRIPRPQNVLYTPCGFVNRATCSTSLCAIVPSSRPLVTSLGTPVPLTPGITLVAPVVPLIEIT